MVSIEEKKYLTKEFRRLFRELFSDERKVWLMDGVHVFDDRTHELEKEIDILTDVNPEFCKRLWEHELLKRVLQNQNWDYDNDDTG